MDTTRVVTVADFYHRSGNGPTNVNSGGAVMIYIFFYIFFECKKKQMRLDHLLTNVCVFVLVLPPVNTQPAKH